jgi:hypothetical protein
LAPWRAKKGGIRVTYSTANYSDRWQSAAELMIEHSVGVRLSRKLEFKRLDEDFFSEE